MATLTKPRAPEGRSGVWQAHIPGRFRKTSVHQLVMAWWLFKSKHITKRQLRVYFAAHEMAERRSYGQGRGDQPLYTFDELRKLIGGSRSPKADANLRTEIRTLARVGLVDIGSHSISFATSIDQIRIDDVSGFWDMFAHFKHHRRTISMPRRTCRALAGGFQTSVMAMMIALLIRSLFWHRPGGKAGEGGYRIDGRTKCSWIADVFGISRRSITEARSTLIELGWITPLEAPQWELNKWGQRYQINVEAFGPASRDSASLKAEFSRQTASPCLNNSSSSSRNIKTRKLHSGVCTTEGKKGSRKKSTPAEPPNLNDIQDADLCDTVRLLELHDQAVGRGLVNGSEAGRLDFLALAERAWSQGNNPVRLFAWLIAHRRFEFITIADEERAADRLRNFRNGPREQYRPDPPINRPRQVEWTREDRMVSACITMSKQSNFEPWDLARRADGYHWTRDEWDMHFYAWRAKDLARWGENGME